MNEKEKAPGSVGALSGAVGGTSGETDSNINFTSGGAGRQGQIIDCLPIGASSPITARELAELCGVQNERQITRSIEALRRAGIAICASTNAEHPGYYLAENPAELALYLKNLDNRLREIGKTRRALNVVLDGWMGQGNFFDGGGDDG